jgi:hypothetical protein
VFGRKEKTVTVRFQGRTYILKKGYQFLPVITIDVDGDIAGKLQVKKNLPIEVVSID